MDSKKSAQFGGITSGGHSSLDYNSYLMVEQLKTLQVCQSEPAHHDEPLFIIIHQTYELWFKLIIHELDLVIELMAEDKVRKATHFMRRAVAIMRLLVQQIHILETMSPLDFLGFRHKLNPASGFQSSQFREIEFMAGLKEERMLMHFQNDNIAFAQLTKRFEAPSLKDCFYELLRKHGFTLAMPPAGDEDENGKFAEERVLELCRLYKDEQLGELHDLAETLIDIDELIALWRTHHVTVVERIIGFKRGTGGSEGVAYLRSTLVKRCFQDLWSVRTALT
ncbi:MAG: tryptophan 2,3-dioxygenase family protein [Candidatus Obscuribacterales bacterium]|jgi:tryptophan 2,3-dioxygenase